MSEVKEIDLKEYLNILMEHDLDIVSRIVYLTSDITNESISKIIKGIRFLAPVKDSDPIHLHISSLGGEIAEMFHLIDVMQRCPVPIYTYGYGEVCSAAVPILAAGDKGYRHLAPNALVMLHQAWGSGYNAYMNEQVAAAQAGLQQQRKMFNFLSSVGNQTASFFESKAVSLGQVWATPEEVKKWGLVDHILEPKKYNKINKRIKSKQ